MAKYRQIHLTFWHDPFIEDLSPLEKYFYLYLMTNSRTTQCGCYEISMKLVKYETGLSQKQVDDFIQVLDNGKKIRFNNDNNEFLIINWLKHNSFRSPKVLTCILGEVDKIKTDEFKQYINSIIHENTSMDSLSIVYDKSIDTGLQKEEEKEEEKEKKKKSFSPPTATEVHDYCLSKNYSTNPQLFIDFYASKGWMVGKNKMKDWQAALRNWESRNNNKVVKPVRKIIQSELKEYRP